MNNKRKLTLTETSATFIFIGLISWLVAIWVPSESEELIDNLFFTGLMLLGVGIAGFLVTLE